MSTMNWQEWQEVTKFLQEAYGIREDEAEEMLLEYIDNEEGCYRWTDCGLTTELDSVQLRLDGGK